MHDGLPAGEQLSPAGRVGVSLCPPDEPRDAPCRLELLLASQRLLDGSLDVGVVSERLARFLVPRIADLCVLDLETSDGSIAATSFAHVDPAKVPLGEQLRRRYFAQGRAAHGPLRVMETGEPELAADIRDELLVALAEDDADLAGLRELGLRSSIVVPVVARGRTLGTLTLALTRPGAPYGPEDVKLAEGLAARAGLAIDNARLYRAERDARLDAEEAAARLRRLRDVASALSETTTQERVAAAVLAQAVADRGGARGAVSALTEDGRAIEVVAHQGGALLPAAGRISIDAPVALALAFRGGEPVVSTSASAEASPSTCFVGGTCRAVIAVPLVASGGRSVGAFLVERVEPGDVATDALAFLTTLGQQGGVALERARLHDAERRARVHAEEANRAKDEFLGVVSHELRTPLNAILGWATLLSGKAEPGTAIDKGVRVIERNARVQAKIIDDILDVSRIITGRLRIELQPTDLGSILRDAIDVVMSSAESKKVTLAYDVPDGLPAVPGDPVRLHQVLWNLLSNAVKFTPQGGRVDASIEARQDSVVVTVTDTGDGLESHFLPHVFERFRQADASAARRHGGLGLGLAIVRHLVELHGGEVVAESEGKGLGARFSVSLPLPPAAGPAVVAQHVSRAPEHDGDLTAPPLDGLRVLVVDDDPDARDVIAAVLVDRGAVVRAVASAQAALDALGDLAPDVLLTDIAMPVEDGYSLLRRLRAGGSPHARLPAVALTAFTRGSDALRAADAGFAAHLPKPVEPNLLSVVLLSVAGRLPARG